MAAVEQYDKSILPRAKETLAVMKQAEEGGEYDFLRVLTARRAYFDVHIELVDAQQVLATAAAQLNGMLLTGGLNQSDRSLLSTGLRSQTLSQQERV